MAYAGLPAEEPRLVVSEEKVRGTTAHRRVLHERNSNEEEKKKRFLKKEGSRAFVSGSGQANDDVR